MGTYVALLTIHVMFLRFFMDGIKLRNVHFTSEITENANGEPEDNNKAILNYLKIWV